MKQVLVTNSDSWGFGTEIVDPKFGLTNSIDRMSISPKPENDEYRVPRIWPTLLGSNLGIPNVVNLSMGANSNDTIYNGTIWWIIKHYLSVNKPTDDLLVVIGWSSLERKNVILTTPDGISVATLWPQFNCLDFYHSPSVREVFKNHVVFHFNEFEYISRFIDQCYTLKLFCKEHNIAYCMFNSFFHTNQGLINSFHDISIGDKLTKWKDRNSLTIDSRHPGQNGTSIRTMVDSLIFKWDALNDSEFFLKDTATFRKYTMDRLPDAMYAMHPNEESHNLWASAVAHHIVESGLL